MGFVHGKDTYISLNAVNLSTFTNNTDFERGSDEHDVTCYGKNSHVFKGGLLNGKCTISGVYDDGATGPRDTIEPLIGTNVTLIMRPEGTGSGLPQDSVDVLVKSFKTSHPVADMVMWSAELTLSDEVTSTNQA